MKVVQEPAAPVPPTPAELKFKELADALLMNPAQWHWLEDEDEQPTNTVTNDDVMIFITTHDRIEVADMDGMILGMFLRDDVGESVEDIIDCLGQLIRQRPQDIDWTDKAANRAAVLGDTRA